MTFPGEPDDCVCVFLKHLVPPSTTAPVALTRVSGERVAAIRAEGSFRVDTGVPGEPAEGAGLTPTPRTNHSASVGPAHSRERSRSTGVSRGSHRPGSGAQGQRLVLVPESLVCAELFTLNFFFTAASLPHSQRLRFHF